MSTEDGPFLHHLEVEIEVELDMARSAHLDEALAVSPADWLFDPADIEREQVGLDNLLGAVEVLETDFETRQPRDVDPGQDPPS